MKAGTGPGIVTQPLGAAGPGPEQALYKYLEEDHRRARDQERAEQGRLCRGTGLRDEQNDAQRTQLWASCLRRRVLVDQQSGHSWALVESADPSPTLDQHEDPQGSWVHPWLPKLRPNPPCLR